MKIIGIGVDAVFVPRVKKAIKQWGNHFLDKIYTPNEKLYCQKKATPSKHFASRFAAKEAFLKALGTGLTCGISFQDIVVLSHKNGKPKLQLKGIALKKSRQLKVKKVFLSLSDEKNMSIAFVVLAS